MPTIKFDKNITCAFSGHRVLTNSFNIDNLQKAVYKAINEGFSIFLVGMAVGFDTVAFRVLYKIKQENKNIEIVACVPCKNQDYYFSNKQKKEYAEMINKADKVIYLSEKYYDGCMRVRNEFMVDNSSRLITYLCYNRGGTYQTVVYAAENNLDIENVK